MQGQVCCSSWFCCSTGWALWVRELPHLKSNLAWLFCQVCDKSSPWSSVAGEGGAVMGTWGRRGKQSCSAAAQVHRGLKCPCVSPAWCPCGGHSCCFVSYSSGKFTSFKPSLVWAVWMYWSTLPFKSFKMRCKGCLISGWGGITIQSFCWLLILVFSGVFFSSFII